MTDAGRWGLAEAVALVRTVREGCTPVLSGPAERLRLSDELSELARRDGIVRARVAAYARRYGPADFKVKVPNMLLSRTGPWIDRADVFDCLLKERGRPGHGCRGAVLHGTGGVGASSCAIAFGKEYAQLFDDGQLYADLRGSAHTTISAGEVLRLFLEKLGMPRDDVPSTPDQRAERLRELTSGRRLLVVLDHISDVDQVTPLLTDDENVFTVVVSANGPMPELPLMEVEIGPLRDRYPHEMVASITSEKRVKTNRRKARTVIQMCEGSPFALQALGEHMRLRPQRSWAEVEGEFRALMRRCTRWGSRCADCAMAHAATRSRGTTAPHATRHAPLAVVHQRARGRGRGNR